MFIKTNNNKLIIFNEAVTIMLLYFDLLETGIFMTNSIQTFVHDP